MRIVAEKGTGVMDVACLVGNGSSIVYNPDLAIGPLTAGIVDAFNALAGTQTGDALAEFAQHVTGTTRDDFEGLLGPLDTITQALPVLGGAAAPFESIPWVARPLGEASDALRRLHLLGLGVALRLIATRAYGQGQDALDAGVGTLMVALQSFMGVGGRLTVATLNYDGLLLASLPENQVADLGRGWGDAATEVLPGVRLQSWPLRTDDDLPDNRPIHLLQLHGSLGWVRAAGEVRKYRIDDLRANEFWTAVAEGQATSEPVVVLTDRKDAVVQTEPFALAYEIFRTRLVRATHWCVAGYSFQDIPVNHALARAIKTRRELGVTDPRLLVLGHDDEEDLRDRVLNGLDGLTIQSLFADGSGLPTSVDGVQWEGWTSA